MKHIDYFCPSIDDPVGDASRYDLYMEMDALDENEQEETRPQWELEKKLREIFGKC